MSTLQQRIVLARKARKLSQANLAERLGVTRTACSHWETGRAKPSTKHIEKIAEILAVDGHWLISGKKRRGFESPLNPDNHAGNSPTTVVLESQVRYQQSFDKETLAIAGEYFALNERRRKLVRDLLQALRAPSKAN